MSTTSNDLIDDYLDLILEANKKVNLTCIDSVEKAQVLHIEDSLAALEEINKAPDGEYGDLGTGAGFPGVPLAITTNRKTLFVDSIEKKTAAIDGAISKLGLSSQIKIYRGRIETLATERPENFAVLTARALCKLPCLLELASPLLEEGEHSYAISHMLGTGRSTMPYILMVFWE